MGCGRSNGSGVNGVCFGPGKYLSSNSACSEITVRFVVVIEHPSFVSIWVTNKNTFFHMRANSSPLVLLDVDICSAPPNSKMWDIRLLAMPKLIWCFQGVKRCGWAAIPNVTISCNSLSYKWWWKARFVKHGDDVFLNGSARSFSHTVLLWTCTDCVLVSYSIIKQIVEKFSGHVLSTFVISQTSIFGV